MVSNRLRVMIVDDEPDAHIVLRELLDSHYEVVSAGNGLEALERVDKCEPDLIVMDLAMPMLDGVDTARAIRKDARHQRIPILFLSAKGGARAEIEEQLGESEAVMAKPFVPSDLVNRLDEMVVSRGLEPRPKSHTIAELERQFGEAPAPESSRGGAETSGERRARTLSEQMAAAAADPRIRILIVDDDRDTVNYMRSVLQDEYEVVGTVESEDAPDKIIAYQPDILLLDIVMPRLNGFHLSQLIRLNRRLRGAKVIFVSSRSDRESVERAFQLGASDFLEKPFTPEQLRRKITEVVRQPGFQRGKKRIDYREILRREGETV
jgi:two-component system cell cycle response regulator